MECRLFCIAAEAEQVARELLGPREGDTHFFKLVEDKNGPVHARDLKKFLRPEEPMHTDFFGSTAQDCQQWLIDGMREQPGNVSDTWIVIVDSRSAQDKTVLLQLYPKELPDDLEPLTFGHFGVLPPERNKWYAWRVHCEYVSEAMSDIDIGYTEPEVTWPIFYGDPAYFMDEHGVIDSAKVKRYIYAEDEEVLQSEWYKRYWKSLEEADTHQHE